MRTKYLCVLIHVRIKGKVGIVKHVQSDLFTDRSKAVLHFLSVFRYLKLCFTFVFIILSCLFIAAL